MSINITTNQPDQVIEETQEPTKVEEVEQESVPSTENVESEIVESNDDASDESETSKEQQLHKETDADNENDDKPTENRGVRKRIKKLSKKLTEREQEIEYWKAEAMKSNSSDKAQEPKVKESTVQANDKPDPDEFETNDEYIEALTDWKLDAKLAQVEQKTKENQMRAEQQQAIDTHVKKVQDFSKTVNDFDDVIEDVDDIPMSLTVQDAILNSDNSAELMYELAKDREEYKRICSLSPINAARALGRFEARLSTPNEDVATKKTISKSNAPKPVTPISGGVSSSGHKSIYDADISQSEYEALRQKQINS